MSTLKVLSTFVICMCKYHQDLRIRSWFKEGKVRVWRIYQPTDRPTYKQTFAFLVSHLFTHGVTKNEIRRANWTLGTSYDGQKLLNTHVQATCKNKINYPQASELWRQSNLAYLTSRPRLSGFHIILVGTNLATLTYCSIITVGI